MPEIVVCVCTRRRHHLLDRVLGALGRVDTASLAPRSVGLLVVDNDPDGAAVRGVCSGRAPGLPLPLRLVEEPRAGLSSARNRAVAEALAWGAGLVAFIDDDDEPCPDWLRHLVAAHDRTGADLVFGVWRLPADLALPPRLAAMRPFQPVRLGEINSYGLPGWAGTYNVLLTRRLLTTLGGDGPLFRPEFSAAGAEDTDLFIRAHRAGFGHAVAADSVITRHWEPDRLTLRGLLRRAYNTGNTRIMLAAMNESPARARKLRRRALLELVRTAGKLPRRLGRPERLGPTLAQMAQYAGQVLYAGTARPTGYYGDHSRRPGRGAAPAGGTGTGSAAAEPSAGPAPRRR